MEEQKKSTRNRKLIAALCSLVLCMLLIGVSVYAALSQSATITNTISITRSGQSFVAIKVEKTSHTGDTAYTATTGEAVGTYAELLNVAAGANGNATDETKMVFSSSVGINAYAYKIHLKMTNVIMINSNNIMIIIHKKIKIYILYAKIQKKMVN